MKIVTAVAAFQHIFGNTVGTRPESGKILLKYQEKQATWQVKVVYYRSGETNPKRSVFFMYLAA